MFIKTNRGIYNTDSIKSIKAVAEGTLCKSPAIVLNFMGENQLFNFIEIEYTNYGEVQEAFENISKQLSENNDLIEIV